VSLNRFVALAVLALLAGCQPARAPVMLAQPKVIVVNGNGPYRHAASGMEFPPGIGEFNRTLLLQYDTGGRNISARYQIDGATMKIEASVYVYPAPPVSGSMRTERCTSQLDAASNDLAKDHPSLRRIGDDTITLDVGGAAHAGQRASFTWEQPLPTERLPAAAQIYLFCRAAESWQVEYRFTYPRELGAAPIIDDFMRRLPWTLNAS
jgi:hypothetical protein